MKEDKSSTSSSSSIAKSTRFNMSNDFIKTTSADADRLTGTNGSTQIKLSAINDVLTEKIFLDDNAFAEIIDQQETVDMSHTGMSEKKRKKKRPSHEKKSKRRHDDEYRESKKRHRHHRSKHSRRKRKRHRKCSSASSSSVSIVSS